MKKNFFKSALVWAAIKTLRIFGKSIKFLPISIQVLEMVDKIEKPLKLLSDGNVENDKEAIAEFWEANRAEFSDFGLLSAASIVIKKTGPDDIAGQVTAQTLVEIAENDGTPLTDEIKGLFPNLAPFFGQESMLGLMEKMPTEKKERKPRTPKVKPSLSGNEEEAANEATANNGEAFKGLPLPVEKKARKPRTPKAIV